MWKYLLINVKLRLDIIAVHNEKKFQNKLWLVEYNTTLLITSLII